MRKIFCLCVSAALFAAVVVSCDRDKDPIPVSEVRLSKPSLTLEIYDFTTLVVTVLPADADNKVVTWESSDANVVKVENGKLTAVDTGTATITVKATDGSGKTATCTVTVTPLDPGETEMIFVEGGIFNMGNENDKDARPVHKVTLSSFKIAKYQVNQVQWRSVIGINSNPANTKGDELPIENIMFKEVQDFINKLNTRTGKKYRLPTEAEWEYAARGGNQSKGYTYSGSNNLDEVGWYLSNSGNVTHGIGSAQKGNELGIYDMSGNVSEYCSDKYALYTTKNQTNPQETVGNGHQVIRGGHYYSIASICTVTSRTYFDPSLGSGRAIYIGFRLVLDVE